MKAAVLLAILLREAVGGAVEPGLKLAVIVGPASVVARVSKDELHELYLRRRRIWSGGQRALPVNLPAGSPARERFSLQVLGRAPDDLVAYWDARYFDGITPPAVLPTAAAVCAFVTAEPAAIGYVPADQVGECRVLLMLE